MRIVGYCSRLCVCVSVKWNLMSGVSVRPENTVMYSAGNRNQKNCGVFSETALFKSYGVICLPMTSYKDTAVIFHALFRRQNLPRVLKIANNRLNTTWNTTLCKVASFVLFILRLLHSCQLSRIFGTIHRGLLRTFGVPEKLEIVLNLSLTSLA